MPILKIEAEKNFKKEILDKEFLKRISRAFSSKRMSRAKGYLQQKDYLFATFKRILSGFFDRFYLNWIILMSKKFQTNKKKKFMQFFAKWVKTPKKNWKNCDLLLLNHSVDIWWVIGEKWELNPNNIFRKRQSSNSASWNWIHFTYYRKKTNKTKWFTGDI